MLLSPNSQRVSPMPSLTASTTSLSSRALDLLAWTVRMLAWQKSSLMKSIESMLPQTALLSVSWLFPLLPAESSRPLGRSMYLIGMQWKGTLRAIMLQAEVKPVSYSMVSPCTATRLPLPKYITLAQSPAPKMRLWPARPCTSRLSRSVLSSRSSLSFLLVYQKSLSLVILNQGRAMTRSLLSYPLPMTMTAFSVSSRVSSITGFRINLTPLYLYCFISDARRVGPKVYKPVESWASSMQVILRSGRSLSRVVSSCRVFGEIPITVTFLALGRACLSASWPFLLSRNTILLWMLIIWGFGLKNEPVANTSASYSRLAPLSQVTNGEPCLLVILKTSVKGRQVTSCWSSQARLMTTGALFSIDRQMASLEQGRLFQSQTRVISPQQPSHLSPLMQPAAPIPPPTTSTFWKQLWSLRLKAGSRQRGGFCGSITFTSELVTTVGKTARSSKLGPVSTCPFSMLKLQPWSRQHSLLPRQIESPRELPIS